MMDRVNKLRKNLDEEIIKAKNDFYSERLDMSIGELLNIYKDNELEISPEFQRLFKWDNYQRTRLIESVILSIPIPPIFVVQNDDGKWELVDGLQRLSTLFSFMGQLKNSDENNWKLDEGDIIKTFKDMCFDDLSTRAKISIKRYVCRVEIISSDNDYNMRYELFNRLNTGGTKLTAQEIRNVIYRDISVEFNKFLRDRGTENTKFLELINISETQEKSLFADELVLRFCALYKSGKLTKVLTKHLDMFMKQTVKETTKDNSIILEYGYAFNRNIELLSKLNDNKIFIPSSGRGGFSTSIYDGVMIGLSNNIELYEDNIKLLREKINLLKEVFNEKNILGSQAHNPKNVMRRIDIAKDIFSDVD